MPIFYNFHILLATFYTIFGTNILIQCPVPVPVCCMFFVSQKIHIKWSPNGIKTYEDTFWNICEFWEVESTRDDARGATRQGARPRGQVRPGPSWLGCGPPGLDSLPVFFIISKNNLRGVSGHSENFCF